MRTVINALIGHRTEVHIDAMLLSQLFHHGIALCHAPGVPCNACPPALLNQHLSRRDLAAGVRPVHLNRRKGRRNKQHEDIQGRHAHNGDHVLLDDPFDGPVAGAGNEPAVLGHEQPAEKVLVQYDRRRGYGRIRLTVY
jgi:hypothetical protein